jgi:hypothetical protein
MGGNVEVQDWSAIVSYDEEAIEDWRRNRRKGKEVHGCNNFSMCECGQ